MPAIALSHRLWQIQIPFYDNGKIHKGCLSSRPGLNTLTQSQNSIFPYFKRPRYLISSLSRKARSVKVFCLKRLSFTSILQVRVSMVR